MARGPEPSLADVATVPGAKGPMPKRAAGDPLPTDDDDELLREIAGMGTGRVDVKIPAGAVLDDTYEIVRRLGFGGMGVVYLARDLKLRRDVAIKLHGALAGEPGGQRLLREAESLAQLVHPNVVTVHSVGTWAGHPYVAMEYVAGGTARTWLGAEKRTPKQIVELFVAAGRGLAAAHARGLVHLDFKPDNVLVGDDGRVRVADFGLARGFDSVGDDAPEGVVRGTPGYMAPEQRARGLVGPPADQFAFAVALWEALSGERPFVSTTEEDVTRAVEAGKLRRPPPGTPRHVAGALARALSVDPAARYPSMDALLAVLAAPTQRRRLALAVGAVVLVAGAAIAFAATRGHPTAKAPFPGPSLAGLWKGDFGFLLVREVDGEIIGVYDHDDGIIRGRMDGGRFAGWWCELPGREAPLDAGNVEMQIGRDKHGTLLVTGRWRYGSDGDWIGRWDLEEDREAPPPELEKRLDEARTLCRKH